MTKKLMKTFIRNISLNFVNIYIDPHITLLIAVSYVYSYYRQCYKRVSKWTYL